MVDYMARAKKRVKLDENSSSNDYELLGPNYMYEDASELFHKAAASLKSTKSWDQAGSTYMKLAECYLKMDSKHEVAAAAAACVDAAHCYKKISPIQAISCLQKAIDLFSNAGNFSQAAQYYKEIGELYEQLRDFKKAIVSFELATELFYREGATTTAGQCKQKVAQSSALFRQYSKAIELFEEMAQEAVNSNLLRYGVRGHLLNAGICHLCNGNLLAVTNALEKYKEFDATFSRTQECKLFADLVAAYEEQNVEKFTEILKDYDSLSPLGSWKINLLLKVKTNLKAKVQGFELNLII